MAAAEEDWAANHITSGMSSGEGVVAALDKVPEKGGRRLLAVEEEFGRTLTALRREHNTLSHVLRSVGTAAKFA